MTKLRDCHRVSTEFNVVTGHRSIKLPVPRPVTVATAGRGDPVGGSASLLPVIRAEVQCAGTLFVRAAFVRAARMGRHELVMTPVGRKSAPYVSPGSCDRHRDVATRILR